MLIIKYAKYQLRNLPRRSKSTKSPIPANSKLNFLLRDMPRERTHVADAQKQRIRIKEKFNRYIPGTVSLQVLGNGAPGSPASVYLFTDQSRYMFNCGEGTQRLAHEHKTKLSRLEHIFMTRISWERIGGLPGLTLTVQDAGVPNITLHGPPGLDLIFRGMKRFVILKDLKVKAINCEHGSEFDDQILQVQCIPLRRNVDDLQSRSEISTHQMEIDTEVDNTNYYEYEKEDSHETPPPSEQSFSTSVKQEENVVISYICKLRPKPGSLNLEKCVEKGVPAGPLLGQLKNGVDITLPDGTQIKADDVRAPTDPGPVFIFIDIPSDEYLKSLEEAFPIFEKYQMNAPDEKLMALVVVHFSPNHIIENEIYQTFVHNFPLSTQHLILNSSNKFSGHLAAHRIQWQLNQLDENIFPILRENPNACGDIKNFNKRIKLGSELKSTGNSSIMKYDHNCFAELTNSLTLYHLRPRKGLDRSNEPVVNPLEYIQETEKVEGFSESLRNLKIKLLKTHSLQQENDLNIYPMFVFLGTGSCIPNKTRNVSSILMHTSSESCILLDCGEGTWGQIVRFYDKIKSIEVIRNLKAIYVSHLHADHHIGLIGILKNRKNLLGNEVPPLLLFAPKQIHSWLNVYDNMIEPISDQYILISNGDLTTKPFSNNGTKEMSIESISTCFVRHCPHSFGVSININNSDGELIKVTYSGDTMPCNELVELGMNSTILIHEATMEDELIAEAKYKMHSTVSQAIEQGQKMNAKYTILTHFSQRYAKLPRIENFHQKNVGIAFDNMQVSYNNLQYLHLIYPTLKLMFSDHCEELEQKALKRALKNERKRLSSVQIGAT